MKSRPLFQVLLPDAVPRPGDGLSPTARAFGQASLAWGASAAEPLALGRLVALLDTPAPLAGSVALRLPGEGEASHDDYFGIGRVRGDAAHVFLAMTMRATLLLLLELKAAPTRLPPARLTLIAQALQVQVAALLGVAAPAVPELDLASADRLAEPQPMRRWLRGHHLFATLTQGLIAELARLAHAAGPSARAAAVDRLVVLLDGAAVTLELTGDFAPDAYETVIRPSMMPPHVPASFSGLLSADHRVFVTRLRELAPTLDTLRSADPTAHARLHAAMGRVYDSHRFVCERFVGGAPSLLRGAGSASSGGQQIEKFKALRLRAFESPADEPATVHRTDPSACT